MEVWSFHFKKFSMVRIKDGQWWAIYIFTLNFRRTARYLDTIRSTALCYQNSHQKCFQCKHYFPSIFFQRSLIFCYPWLPHLFNTLDSNLSQSATFCGLVHDLFITSQMRIEIKHLIHLSLYFYLWFLLFLILLFIWGFYFIFCDFILYLWYQTCLIGDFFSIIFMWNHYGRGRDKL